ncbi:hypothetical protein NKR19_g4281 [Coniochaeta hoffmannii]|uniref:Uncharacterized protein n=1 Tax=Coniochaeta hoffmannii TaxID=91930 RepID=A0AA38VWK6_9PEZI|nr:hypothetical protein NKR19_g4281 [Coniochaeta hoffmannii]
MVPVQALEQTALQFIGHGWGCWGKGVGVEDLGPPPASWRQIYGIVWPALWSLGSALGFEVPMAVFLSVIGGRPFALYINGAEEMAAAGTAYMWRSIDWCYIFYAMSTQLAHSPARYEAETVNTLDQANAWTYHSLVFGGSLVFSFVDILVFDSIWTWTLMRGKATLEVFRE